MKNIIVCIITMVLMIFSPQISNSQDSINCKLKEYLQKVRNFPGNGNGISPGFVKLSDTIVKFGDIAIPGLIEIMNDPNEYVRTRAGYILSAYKRIDEKYLDDLIIGLDNDVSWISYAVARFKNEKAINALIKSIKRGQANENEFVQVGIQAIPYLFKLYNQTNDEAILLSINGIFENYEEEKIGKNEIIAGLTKIIKSRKSKNVLKSAAINCISNYGEEASGLENEIIKIYKSNPKKFEMPVYNYLINIKSEKAIPFFERFVNKNIKNNYLFCYFDRIKQLGPKGYSAGPFVEKFLTNNTGYIKHDAIDILSTIGYKKSIPKIRKLLFDENDWRVVLFAVSALARFQDSSSIPYLETIANTHWYPPVRDMAQDAILYIQGDTTFKNKMLDFTVFSINTLGEYLKRVQIKNPIKSDTLFVNGGYFTCQSHGEFGGELCYTNKICKKKRFTRNNVSTITTFNNKIVAIGGVRHMGTNEGNLYVLEKSKKTFKLIRNINLPGNVYGMELMNTGELLIDTNCGSVILTKEFKLKMVG